MLDKISSKDILGGKIKKVDIVNIDKFLDYFFFFFLIFRVECKWYFIFEQMWYCCNYIKNRKFDNDILK